VHPRTAAITASVKPRPYVERLGS